MVVFVSVSTKKNHPLPFSVINCLDVINDGKATVKELSSKHTKVFLSAPFIRKSRTRRISSIQLFCFRPCAFD